MKLVIFSLLVGAIMADDTGSVADPHSCTCQHKDTDEGIQWAPFDGRFYASVEHEMLWTEAQKHCMNHGGSLASIPNKDVDAFVKALAKSHEAWIGYSDAQSNDCWLWINSDPSDFNGWCPDAGKNHTCALTNFSDAKCWGDMDCNKAHPFVCSKN